jgi:hypothetical protein
MVAKTVCVPPVNLKSESASIIWMELKVGICEHYLNGIKVFSERELKVCQAWKIYNYSDIFRIYLTIRTVAMPVVTMQHTSVFPSSNCIIP